LISISIWSDPDRFLWFLDNLLRMGHLLLRLDMSKGQECIDRSAQMVAQGQPRAAPQPMDGSAAMKGDSAAPHRKGKTTSSSSAHVKPMKKVSHPEQVVQKPKKSI